MNDFIDDGEYKIIMKLEQVPEFTIVTKPTGVKAYEVKHRLPVHADGKLKKEMEIKMPDWCIYLVHSGGVDVEYPETRVAVHFDTLEQLAEFIELIGEQE